jgi:hypothetical protein
MMLACDLRYLEHHQDGQHQKLELIEMGTSLGPRRQAEMTERGSFGDLGLVKQTLNTWKRLSVPSVVTDRVQNVLHTVNRGWVIVASLCPVGSLVDLLDRMNASRRDEDSIQTRLLDGTQTY